MSNTLRRFSLLVSRSSLAFLSSLTFTSLAGAATQCPGYVAPVTCSDGITRQPGDILIGTISSGTIRLIGLRPNSSPSNPTTYVHAEFPGSSLGDIVAVPESPREFVFTATLNETNGRMTVGKVDACGNLVDATFGDFTGYYESLSPTGLGFHYGIAVHPNTGDFYVAGLPFHPPVQSGPRHSTHRHFAVPSTGGEAAWWYSWGYDDYGTGDSRLTGGAIFDHDGNYWQSGYGQESLSVIAAGQPWSQEYRLDYDPQNHNAPGYQGLHDMVVEETNSYIYALGLDFSVRRIDLQTRERTAWYTDSSGRSFMFATIDRFDRLWIADRDGHVLRLSNTNAQVGQLYADYDIGTGTGSVKSIAVYGDNEPQIRETCE